MENNKLQELTQKLYNEGLEKGRTEADRLVAEAKQETEQSVPILIAFQAFGLSFMLHSFRCFS